MTTPQQIYYQNHREEVLKYKKAFYAKKSHKQELAKAIFGGNEEDAEVEEDSEEVSEEE